MPNLPLGKKELLEHGLSFPINTLSMQHSIEQISAQFQLGALVQLAIQITNKPMALKSLFLISLLLVGFAVAPTIAQLGGLGNLLGGLIDIRGVLFCTANGNANDTSTPVFPNAVVELQCGNTVVSSTTTNGAGTFTFLLDPLTTLLPSLLNNCMLVVKTPLSACNAALPAGILQSPLQFLGKTLLGILGVLNLGPTGFSLIPSSPMVIP